MARRTIVGRIATRLAVLAGIGGSLALVACGGLIPDPFPGSSTPRDRPRAVSPSFDLKSCGQTLERRGVEFRYLRDEDKPGQCEIVNAVQLLDFGVPVSGLGPMTCRIADGFTAWVMSDVEDAARRHIGANVVRIESFGTYSCRNIAGSGRISEHALANAVDIAAFRFSDGQRISVLNDWNGSRAHRAFLRDVADGACKRFGTVLTPDYNEAHRDHLHLDMADRRSGYCR